MQANTTQQALQFVDESVPALQLVDLSVPVDANHWEPDVIRCEYIDHRRGADLLGSALIHSRGRDSLRARVSEWLKHKLGLGVDHRDFPDGKGLSLMRYTLTTHTGTHMDAPFHYGDVDAKGRRARTICEVPLEWCFRDGVVLDVRGPAGAGPVTRDEVLAALGRIGYTLKPLDVVLLRTGGDTHVGKPGYFSGFRGVTEAATRWLVEQGIRVIGIDSFGFDAPFHQMLEDYLRTGKPSALWPAHLFGRESEYCQLERLANLDKLERPYGFKVSCFPIKLARADAAWCRVVALV
ncbi:cyclase family protein [Pyxidicoccus trucidator]|uniref:cyclase family protein n=1 Tax=Pyxidicoccus trucidator TaxID=2709662 RepID=UPI0013D98BAC|nr:cyclase family protein [Pyxidicoccus trucidator]